MKDALWVQALHAVHRGSPQTVYREMASIGAFAYAGGAMIGAASLLLASMSQEPKLMSWLLAGISLAAAGLLLGAVTRKRFWAPIVSPLIALALLACGVWAGEEEAAGSMAVFYLVLALYCFHYFRPGLAVTLVLLGASSYASTLHVKGVSPWPSQTVLMLGGSLLIGVMLTKLVRPLTRLANEDALTGLANRRAWSTTLQHQLLNTPRSGKPFSVALLDMDEFKALNDQMGHLAGDETLKKVGDALRKVTRQGDLAARWGGDEFALLLPDCDEQHARLIVERLKSLLPEGVSISAGIATLSPGQFDVSEQELIRLADEQLYQAKQNA